MDYYSQYNNIKSMNDSNKSNNSSKKTRILLSVSVFAVLLSQSSLIPLLFHSYENLALDLNNFKFKFFTYTTERNCIFLLCNGILLLIIQSSGLISKITPVVLSGSKAPRFDDHREVRDDECEKFGEKGKKGAGKCEILEEKTWEKTGEETGEKTGEKTGEIGGEVAAEFVEMEENDDQSSCEVEEIEEEEEEEEEDGVMCNDELNKKCEEFIKRMKKLIQGV